MIEADDGTPRAVASRTGVDGRSNRLGPICTTLFLLVCAIGCLAQVGLLKSANWSLFDTRIYLDATKHVLHGSDELYSAKWGDGWPFTYPAFAVVVFAPFASISWGISTAVLTFGGIAALARICWLCGDALVRGWARERGAGEQGPAEQRTGAGAWTVGKREAALLIASGLMLLSVWSDPVKGTLGFGQVNLVLAWLVVEDYLGERRYGGWLSGIAAGIKVTPALAAVPRLLAGEWRLAVRSVIAGLATVAVSSVLLPHETWEYFTKVVWDTRRPGDPWQEWNQSLTGLASRVTHDGAADGPLKWALVFLALGAGVYAARNLLLADDRLGAVLVVFVCTGAVSPISWYHHLVMVPIFCVWAIAAPRAWPRNLTYWIAAQAVVLGAWDVTGMYQLVPRDNGVELHHSLGETLMSEVVPFFSLTILLTLAAATHLMRDETGVRKPVLTQAEGAPARRRAHP